MTRLDELVTISTEATASGSTIVLRVSGGKAREPGPLAGLLKSEYYEILVGVTASYEGDFDFDVFERGSKVVLVVRAEVAIADRPAAFIAAEAAAATGWLSAVVGAVRGGISKAVAEAPSPERRNVVDALIGNRTRIYDAIRAECRHIGLAVSKLSVDFKHLHDWPIHFEKGTFVIQADARAVDAKLDFMLELHPDHRAAYYATSMPARGPIRSIEAEMMSAARKAVDGKFSLQQWRQNLPQIVSALTDALNLRAKDFGLILIGKANLQTSEYRPERPIDLDGRVVHKLLGTPRELTINYRCTLTLDDLATWEQLSRNDKSLSGIKSFAESQVERAVALFLRDTDFTDAVDLILGRRADGTNPRAELGRFVREELSSVLAKYGWGISEEFFVVPNDIPESQLIRGEATIRSPMHDYDLSTSPDRASVDVTARAVLEAPAKLVPYLRIPVPIEEQVKVEVEHTIATFLGSLDALAFHRLSTEQVNGRKTLHSQLLPRVEDTLARYGIALVDRQGADGGLVLRLKADPVTERLKALKNLPVSVSVPGTVQNDLDGRQVHIRFDVELLIKDWAAQQDDLDVFFTRATSLTLERQVDMLRDLVHSVGRIAASYGRIGWFQTRFFLQSGLNRAMQKVIEDRAASEHGLRVVVNPIVTVMQDTEGDEAYVMAELARLQRLLIDTIGQGDYRMGDSPEEIQARIDRLKKLRADGNTISGNYYVEQSTPSDDATALAEIIKPLLQHLADTDRLQKVVGISSDKPKANGDSAPDDEDDDGEA